MKSMNSADEAPESMNVSPGDEALGGATVSAADAKRRRLVRGAVAFAPLVLTLRSGALAAASCTGVKIASVSVKNGAPRAGELLNPSSSIAAGDVCVDTGVLLQCDAPHTGKVKTNSPITAANTEPVLYRPNATGNPPNPYWTCGNGREFQGHNVAILSSQSVTSMVITP